MGDGDDGEYGGDERVEAPEVPQTFAADARAARHRELTVLFSVDLIRKGVCSIFEETLWGENTFIARAGKMESFLPIYYCVSLRMRVGFLLLLLLLLLLQILLLLLLCIPAIIHIHYFSAPKEDKTFALASSTFRFNSSIRFSSSGIKLSNSSSCDRFPRIFVSWMFSSSTASNLS